MATPLDIKVSRVLQSKRQNDRRERAGRLPALLLHRGVFPDGIAESHFRTHKVALVD